MKRILLILGTLLSLTTAMADSLPAYEYVPLVREGVEWVYYHRYGWPGSDFEKFYYYGLRFDGTTEIEGVTYHNLWMYNVCNPYDENGMPVAYMREENKHVYCRHNLEYYSSETKTPIDGVYLNIEDENWDCSYSSEHELYDFNVNVLENYPFKYTTFWDDSLFVTSIALDNGGAKTWRKKYQLNREDLKYFNHEYDMIEGIGLIDEFCMLHYTNSACAACSYSGPYFMYEKDLESGELAFNRCADWDIMTEDGVNCDMLSVSKLPKADDCTIQYSANSVYTSIPGKFNATVFDTEGRQCGSFSGCDELRIPTTGMTAGVYILHVTRADGTTATAKFEVR